jgi:hypothetical protein
VGWKATALGGARRAEMLPMGCPSEETLHRQLFDRQVERLIECGYHKALGMMERDLRLWLAPLAGLLGKVGGTAPDHIPFLIVVPHGMLPIERQIELLVVAKKRGYAGSLGGEKFVNLDGLGSSKFPYLIRDVNDGAVTVGQITAAAMTSIRHACRNGLTVEEGIALAVHSPDILIHHSLATIDTDYNGYVPELWLCACGPTFTFDFPNSRREGRGVPYGGRRLLLDR